MMQLASRNVKPANLCVCTRLYSTTPPQVNKLDEFTEADHMLRPPPKKELSIMSFHKKHFRKSRFENYEDVGNGKNTNLFIRGDPVPNKNDMNFKFALTSKNSSPLPSREQFGDKVVQQAKEKSEQTAKWYNKAMYDTGSAAQVDELFELASKAGVVDNKLISTYIYNLARRNGQEKAIAKYESVKDKADADIHASGAAAYAKAMNGPKALEIFNSLLSQGADKVPTRLYSAIMSFHFDNGETRKGVEIFNNFEKAGGKADVKMLTTLLRGNRHNKSLEQTQKIFDSIKERGLTPDKDAYSELVIAYAKGGKDVGVMTGKIEEMKNAGFRVPHYVYSSAIRAMLANNEYSNGLMTLDTQYREGAFPLDKNIVVILAQQERGMRVRPKTEYTIWVAKQAGLYAKDLTYLTTQQVDFMDEYYFRHHPEYDYPDALKKSYQFKSFDEYALFFPEEDRNPFARKPTPPAAPKSDEDIISNLPDQLEFNVTAVDDIDIDIKWEYKRPKKAEVQIEEYDKHVWSLWTQRTALQKAQEDQAKAAKEAVAAIEKAQEEAKAAETEAANKLKAETEAAEKAKTEETKPESATEIKKAEEKAMEAENKAAEAKEEAVKAEERAEEAKIKAKQRELEESEIRDIANAKAEMAEAKAEKAEKEAEKAQVKADEADKEADLATANVLKKEGLLPKESEQAEELKKPESRNLDTSEEEEEEDKNYLMEDGGAKAIVADEFKDIYARDKKKHYSIGGFKKRPDDSILEPEKRMPEFVRKELVQQARIERLTELLESPNRLPPTLPYYLLAGLDVQRLTTFIDACKSTLDNLSREPDNFIRPAVDLYLVQQHVKGYLSSAVREKSFKTKQLYKVYKPLDLEVRRTDLTGTPLWEDVFEVLNDFTLVPPADSYVFDEVDSMDALEREIEELQEEHVARQEKDPKDMKSWELVNAIDGEGNKENTK